MAHYVAHDEAHGASTSASPTFTLGASLLVAPTTAPPHIDIDALFLFVE